MKVCLNSYIAIVDSEVVYLSLKPPDPVQLTLFKNGIIMFDGPFRPYSDLSTQVGHESTVPVRQLAI